jgi:hypothetical protein
MILLIASIIWAYALFYCTIRLYQNLDSFETGAFSTLSTLKSGESITAALPALEQDLYTVERVLPKLKRNATGLYWLSRPLTPAIGLAARLPGIGPYARQINPLLHYAKNLSQGGSKALPSAVALVEMLQRDATTGELIQQVNVVLLENQAALRRASERIEKAVLARERLDPSLLPSRAAEAVTSLDGTIGRAENLLDALASLPDVLGSGQGTQNYILLAQNRDELRATGGFISGIGRLELDEAEIVTFEIGDSYSVDEFSQGYPTPPEPLERFMLAELWLPRDANWSPDFPTAARQVQELVALPSGQPSDGVIAFDQEAVRILVDVLGPLEIDPFPEAVTADNVEALIQQAWSASPSEGVSQAWWQQRKDFMPQLGTALLEALLASSDKETLLRLGRELVQAMRAGHVLVTFSDSQHQALLAEAGLDNGIHPGEGDYLLVVDSNVGFNKVDAVVQRRVTYLVELSTPQEPMAMLINHYRHTIGEDIDCVHQASYGTGAYGDLQKRCYWNYWRVYKSAGTGLYAANQTPVPGEWLLNGRDWDGRATIEPGINDTEMASGLFVLPTNQSQDVVLQFALPPEVIVPTNEDELVYKLEVHKQAGLDDLPVSIQVRPPQGTQLKAGDPWRYDQSSGFWIWDGRVTTPERFELVFVER